MWRFEHLLNNEQSLVRQLTSRINGRMKVFARGSPDTRLKVANDIFNSKLYYLIALWGGVKVTSSTVYKSFKIEQPGQ